MEQELEIIRRGLDNISIRGRENIELMGMCMDALDELIARRREEKETNNEDD